MYLPLEFTIRGSVFVLYGRIHRDKTGSSVQNLTQAISIEVA